MFKLIETEIADPIDGTWILSKAETKGGISDGYHTFDELYAHRITLYIQFCKLYSAANQSLLGRSKPKRVWRSLLHSDGTSFDGWFVLGIGTEPGEQITYHLPLLDWVKCNFAETLEKAPEFDGHTASDVLERIARI